MKKLNFSEKYLIILVMLCFIVIGLYYSYAIFVTKQLQENFVVINTKNNNVVLKSNYEDNSIEVSKNNKETLTLSVMNKSLTDYYYQIFVKGLNERVKVTSEEEVYGKLSANDTKNISLIITNLSDEDVKVSFEVFGSISDDIEKGIGYSYINKDDTFDHAMANHPKLDNLNLIPVSYKKINDKEGFWYKTDSDNTIDLWYSYDAGIWANAVLVNKDNYRKYQNMEIGSEIDIGDVLGFYVWIPRFKYYILNGNNYTNYERINNIIFEKGISETGTVTCEDRISNSIDRHYFSEVCSDSVYGKIYNNLSTYTHPAFKDQTGFWVSKFLVSENMKSIPNANILKKNIFDAISLSNNLISNKTHLMTNMEYAAVLMLSNSLYGKSGNKDYYTEDNLSFQRVYGNNYLYNMTGCGTEYNSYSKNYLTNITKTCVEYNDFTDFSHISNGVSYPIGKIGTGSSTTGTIYGVYDMVVYTGELVSAVTTDQDGNTSINTKYLDKYSYNDYLGNIGSSSTIYNLYRYKLGDAIRENFRSFNENGMWNNGTILHNVMEGVIVRGGNGIEKNTSIYTVSIEDYKNEYPFRTVIFN